MDTCSYMGAVNPSNDRHKTSIIFFTVENLENIKDKTRYYKSYLLLANLKALVLIRHKNIYLVVLKIVI